jgi:hypothetical protein
VYWRSPGSTGRTEKGWAVDTDNGPWVEGNESFEARD